MTSIKTLLRLLIILLMLGACTNDDDIKKDLEKPTITVNYTDGFPQGCAQLKRGETYTFRAKVTDNMALAAYSLDMHHNFDHHTHDDQITTCDLEEIKSAVNPFIYLENFQIEGSLTTYEIKIEIKIPEDIDTGDYHCAYSVADTTGWQSRTSIDIKIIE